MGLGVLGGFAFCFCCNGLGFIGYGGGSERLGFWEALLVVFVVMVWILLGVAGGGWFWGVEGLGLRRLRPRGAGPSACTWVVVEGLGSEGLLEGDCGV